MVKTNLKEKWNKWKNGKWLWDVTRIDVTRYASGDHMVTLKDYEYLAKMYKGLYFNNLLLMFGVLVFAIIILVT